MTNIPSCPFCGNQDLIFNGTLNRFNNGMSYFIECKKCETCGPSRDTPAQACTSWGVRIAPSFNATVEGFTNDKDPLTLKTGD